VRSVLLAALLASGQSGPPLVEIDRPMSPPAWALLERELLRTQAEACEEFFSRYFDERGYLRCVVRWGGDDGPDDAIENVNGWPVLHALGAPDRIRELVHQAWEGHLRQYTEARTVEVPFARDGMYYKEFPVMFDWQHNGEGMTVFNLMGLSAPDDPALQARVRRYAGFYMNEDPGAPNYDPKHKIIRSLFNGSRGPLLRKATALDWTGDPIEVENRFVLGHGERNYAEMLAHFKDYNDIVGDHPLNLLATTLALNAYMLAHEEKYRRWLLEYADAWVARMAANGGIIPSNVGLDGTIGGECGGKWYGGVYGWSFSPTVPQTGKVEHRNRVPWSFFGLMNAYVLTADDRYLDAWRRQVDAVNANAKTIDGRKMYPRMHGDQGWYGWDPRPYDANAVEIYYLSMKPADRARVPSSDWLDYLDGKNPDYPERALRRDLERVRGRVEAMRRDPTTPDTRLADDPMKFNPASVEALVQLALGGLPIRSLGTILPARLRYFDPVARRAGLPPDVAALVERMTADEVTVVLVNTGQVRERRVIVQAGGYAEHRFLEVRHGDRATALDGATLAVRLAPGAGERLTLRMKRYANPPTLRFPWER